MRPALIERFPGTVALPLAGIATLPTRVEALPLLADEHDIHALWTKRDDLTSPIYGGNKVRKLDFLLGDAVAKGSRAVITFGAYGSNHALATAVHASALGLEPHVVLSPQEPGPYAKATLLAHAGLGTKLHVVEGWDGSREGVRVRRELAGRDGVEPYVIPMGGTSALGALGYVNAAFEILAQEQTREIRLASIRHGNLIPPDVVYVPGGTLGTAVGLAIGFAAGDQRTRVETLRVTPGEVANPEAARELTAATVALLRSVDPGFPELAFEDLALNLRDDWFEPGYGVVTPETLAAVETAAGIGYKLETTYTGKAFAAMLADARAGLLTHAHVLFIDTYNSAPMPAPGSAEELPPVLQEYIAECDRLFGGNVKEESEGDAE